MIMAAGTERRCSSLRAKVGAFVVQDSSVAWQDGADSASVPRMNGGRRSRRQWVLVCGAVTLAPGCGLPASGLLAENGSNDASQSTGGSSRDASSQDAMRRRDGETDAVARRDAPTSQDAAADTQQLPDVSNACTEACPIGARCDAGASCGTLACTNGVCAACSPTCATGASCAGGNDCASGACSDGNCVIAASCAAILAANPSAHDGAYPIEPAGVGTPFAAYCDMTDMGGGWTLVAKMGTVGAAMMGGTAVVPGTFDYTSTHWTLGTTLNVDSTDMSETEAMFPSYSSVPFKSILGMMTSIPAPPAPAKPTELVIPVGDATSLLDLIANTNVNTLGDTLTRQDWLTFVPGAMVQPNCNEHGINWTPSADCGTNGARIRIGLIANNDNDCCSPDSYVGFGGEYDNTVCNQASYSAGSMGGQGCSGGNNVQDFGYLFVR